jgi:SAM-dependent methyltransferase
VLRQSLRHAGFCRSVNYFRMKPYEKLALLYEKDWGKFSLGYLDLLNHVFKSLNFTPSCILDIACGTGELISKLQAQGYCMVGADISPDMIKIAKIKNPEVEFFACDMSELNLNKKFDLIICPFDSLNYLLNDEKVKATFSKVYAHLNVNGFFIFDFNTPILYIKKHHGTIDRDVDGLMFKQILKYDEKKKIAYTDFIFSGAEVEEHIQRAYSKDEIIQKLIINRYRILGVYENLQFEDADNDSEKIYIVAQK